MIIARIMCGALSQPLFLMVANIFPEQKQSMVKFFEEKKAVLRESFAVARNTFKLKVLLK